MILIRMARRVAGLVLLALFALAVAIPVASWCELVTLFAGEPAGRRARNRLGGYLYLFPEWLLE